MQVSVSTVHTVLYYDMKVIIIIIIVNSFIKLLHLLNRKRDISKNSN